MNPPSLMRVSGVTRELREKINEIIDYQRSLTPRPSASVKVNHTRAGVYYQTKKESDGETEVGVVHQAVIREIHDDHLLCRLRSSTNINETFLVAKPWSLRVSSYGPFESSDNLLWGLPVFWEEDGQNRTLKKTIQDADGNDKVIEIDQQLIPGYGVEDGDIQDPPTDLAIIYVAKVEEDAELVIDGEAVEWIDLNVDARRFEMPIVPFKLCQNGVVLDALFVAGEAT